MASLYELASKWASLVDAYDMAEDADEQALALEDLITAEGAIEEKAEAYARIMRNYQAEAETYKAEAQRLAKRQKAAENAVERMKIALLDAMKLTDTTEIRTGIGKWKVQTNPWSCDVLDETKIPARYHIPQPDKIDKRALLADFKATGEIMDGVEFKQTLGLRFR